MGCCAVLIVSVTNILILSLTLRLAYSNIIQVGDNGKVSVQCCKQGECICGSLYYALQYLDADTVVNITGDSATLNNVTQMGLGYLSNITVTGNNVIIYCNKTGRVFCESCSNVTIKGITWNQCGWTNLSPTVTPALYFTNISDLIVQNCTFQNSSGCQIHLTKTSGQIVIQSCNFVAISLVYYPSGYSLYAAGLYVENVETNSTFCITLSGFYDSICGLYDCPYAAIINSTVFRSNIFIKDSEFSTNPGGALLLNIHASVVQLSGITVFNNGMSGSHGGINIISHENSNETIINVSSCYFQNNKSPLTIFVPSNPICSVVIRIYNSTFINNIAIALNLQNLNPGSSYKQIREVGVFSVILLSSASVLISNCTFFENLNGAIGVHLAPPYCGKLQHLSFSDVTISQTNDSSILAGYGSVSIAVHSAIISLTFERVDFLSNHYLGQSGSEVLYMAMYGEDCDQQKSSFAFIECMFKRNVAFNHVVALYTTSYIGENSNYQSSIYFENCIFDYNVGGSSIVHVMASGSLATVLDSSFSNNNGTALYISIRILTFYKNVLFKNNKATNGAAVYLMRVHSMLFQFGTMQFINNFATMKGGAIYIEIAPDNSNCQVFGNVDEEDTHVSFVNNSAGISGNSFYFSIPQLCNVIANVSNRLSLLHIPSLFHYYPEYSQLVTSPHNIKLYQPAIAMYNNTDNNYLIQNSKMLGESIYFTATVFDYFDTAAEPVIFVLICNNCKGDYALSKDQISVANNSLQEFKVYPTNTHDVVNATYISIMLQSVLSPIYEGVNATLSIQLSPCHSGYLFDKLQLQCICYQHHDIVHCNEESFSEIKAGYWVGFVLNTYTSSICPSNYCKFAKRVETSPGYYELTDDQCSSHRMGVACGRCHEGYTLAYDSPNCISRSKCSTGMTILVIILTILYWIAVVSIVFILMYFQLQISSGYVFGIIYYYSIVDTLLGNNLYISDGVFQLVNILSSFAKLTPQVFGQLCFIEDLSGIDQQFVHYIHALAVLLILLIIVVVARYSPRLAVFVGRCIIRVICLLLLLSYTSLASTSLQLLRPLKFHDVSEVHTYSSPDLKYFAGRHLAYGIVAILCEVFVLISFPLLLLLEPFLRHRVNFIRIKPLLDQFQGCYKGRYHCFAAYYLICRQVIFVIVFVANENYSNMLYYLHTVCIVIAMVHIWVQPYENEFLNAWDGILLLTMVLVVNLNAFTLSVPAVEIIVILVLFPIFLFFLVVVVKLIGFIVFKLYQRKAQYKIVEDEDNGSVINQDARLRYVTIASK